MRNKTILTILSIFMLVCVTLRADTYPLHQYIPTVCSPPPPPTVGQPGYGPLNPFPNGVFFNPDTGFWIIPDGLWNPNDSDRDVEMAAMIEDLMNPPPLSRPAWAISDSENGMYYWGGGYYGTHYYPEGLYLPEEIW